MERKLGNIFGFTGGNYAGNVYDQNYMCPTLNTMQGGYKQPMIVENITCHTDRTINCGKEFGTVDDLKLKNINTEVASAVISRYWKGIEGSNSNAVIVAMRGRNPDNPSDRTAGSPTEQRLEPNIQGICNTLTSVQKDNMVMESKIIKVGQISSEGSEYGTVISENGISSNLVAGTHGYANNCIATNYRIRKLTPRECWRLMDFTDEDFFSAKTGERSIATEMLLLHSYNSNKMMEYVEQISNMSNTQLYKQAGNSIVKNCMVAILGQMLPGKEDIYKTRCS